MLTRAERDAMRSENEGRSRYIALLDALDACESELRSCEAWFVRHRYDEYDGNVQERLAAIRKLLEGK